MNYHEFNGKVFLNLVVILRERGTNDEESHKIQILRFLVAPMVALSK